MGSGVSVWGGNLKIAGRAAFVGVMAAVLSFVAGAQITPSAPALLNTDGTTDDRTDERPQIATDGAGNWVAIWDAWDLGGSLTGPDLDIFVTRSTDAGQTWTTPAPLNTNATTDGGDDLRPVIVTDSDGVWIAVWYSNENLNGTAGADFDILYSRSTDAGQTWSAPALLNTNGNEDSGTDEIPKIATDSAGNWVAVWDSNESLDGIVGFDFEVFVSTSSDGGLTWSAPTTLNSNAASDDGNDIRTEIVTDRQGTWVVAWASNALLGALTSNNFDIFVSRSTDNGATWSGVERLDSNDFDDTGEDARPALAVDDFGRWTAAWHANDNLNGLSGTDTDIFVSRSTDGGATWSTEALLNTNGNSDSGEDEFVRLTADGTGNLIAIWDSNEDLDGLTGTDYDVLVSRSTNGGLTWSAPALFNTNGEADSNFDLVAQIATDRAGTWVAPWESNENLGGVTGPDWDILFSRFTLSPGLAATTITPETTGPTNAASVSFDVTFSHDAQNFDDASDVVVTHSGTANAGVTISGGPRVYTVDVTGLSGEGTFTLAVSAVSDVENLSGDPLLYTVTSAPVAIERVAPTITLSSAAPSPTNSAISVTAELSEASTNFGSGDVTPTNATVSDFAGSDTSYSFTLTPTTDGTFSAIVNAGAFTDAIGNGNIASNTISRTADLTGPTVSLSSASSAFVNGAVGVSVSLSEASANFTAGDVSVSNATLSDFAGLGSSYSFTLTPDGEGAFSAVVNAGVLSDGLGNINTASNTLARTADFTAPTAVLSSAAGDPVNGAITVSVALSESSGNFTAGDVTTTNATLSGFSGSGSSYSFTLTPDAEGDFDASVDATTFTDAAGNSNTASNTLSRTADLTAPTAILGSAAPNPANGAITVDVDLSEPSANFTAGDLSATNATVSDFSGSGDAYSFTLTPDDDGVFSVVINAGAFTDAAGNGNLESNTLSRTADVTNPTITLSSASAGSVNAAIIVDVTLSETSTDFDGGDVSVTNATLSDFDGAGTSYSFTLTPNAEGAFSASVDAATFTDDSGNANTASNTLTRTADFTAPTVAMASASANPTSDSPIAVTVTFSEPVTGFSAGDVSANNASVSNFAGTGSSYSFDLTPSGQGAVTADVAGSVAIDAAGNPNTAATQFSRSFDSVLPGVSMSSAAPNPTNGSPIPVTVTFTESVTGFQISDIQAVNATVDNFAGSGASYTFDLIPSADGSVTADIEPAVAVDAAGNASTAATQFSRVYDATVPTALLSSSSGDPVNGAITVNVVLSEASVNFTSGDVSVTNATVSNFAGSGASYSFTLTPSAEGAFSASVDAGAFTDAANNPNTASNTLSRTADLTAPTVAMSSAAANPTNTSPMSVTVTFSESVTGFTSGDVTAANATVSNFAGSGASYSFDLTPSNDGTVTADIAGSVAIDAAGNANTAAPQFGRVYDATVPTVVLSSSSGDPVNGAVTIDVTLSEASVNFAAGDVSATNATVSDFAGSGASYSFTLTPGAEGEFTSSVDAATFTDAAGNANTASNTLTRTADFSIPTATLASTSGNSVNAAISVTVTLSDASTNFESGDVTLVNSTLSDFAGSGSSYSFTLTPDAEGTFSAQAAADTFTDASGNLNATSNTLTRTADFTAPGVTMSSTTTDPTNANPIVVSVTFTEPVTGFVAGDITAGNAIVSNFAGSGASYTFNLVPTSEGTVTADIAAGVAADAATNLNTAATQFSRTYDATAPTATLSSAAGNPVNAAISVGVELSISTTEFTSSDLQLTNATVSGFSGSGTTYSFTLTPAADGTFSVLVAAGAFTDGASNGNTASNTISRTADLTRPTVSMSSAAPNPTTVSPIPVTVTFSESVTGFTADDITAGNATATNFAGSGASYSFDLVPASGGSVTANIASDVSLDAAGNTNTAATQFSRTFNQTPVITAIDDVTITDGASYSVTPALQQGSGTMTWSLTAPASPPTNMAINSSTGQLTWTANFAFSPVDVTITATGPGGSDTESWRITVTPPPIWVDFAYTGAETGTVTQPFNTLSEAVNAAVPGDEIRIKGNTAKKFSLETGTISKPLIIDATGGTIRVGGSFGGGGGGGIMPVQGTTGFVSRGR